MVSADDGSLRILLVDQSGALEKRLEDALAADGFDSETAESGCDCLRRIRSGDIDGIISEYSLPDIDGIQLLKSVRVSHPVLPFILLPDTNSASVAGDAITAGVSGYAPKHADPSVVLSRLRGSLKQARTKRDDESQYRYRHMIEMSPAPINLFDETGESIWCNEAVVELLDLEGPEDLIGEQIFDFIHPDDRSQARKELERVIENKESVGPTRMKLRTADGEVRYVQVSTAVGEFRRSDIGQAIVVDATEREERDQQLQVLERWLRHNIRNEVSAIYGLADNIKRGNVADVEAAAGRIRDHATRLSTQADRERQVIELLSNPPDPVPTDLTALVEQCVAGCRSTYPEADIELTMADPITVTAIPTLGEAITELIENAVKHNDTDSPTVHVAVTENDRGRGVVRVIDNGPSIPKQDCDDLLIGHDASPVNHGTGLGLIFVSWVVRLSDGTITIEEAEPRGSTVTLAF